MKREQRRAILKQARKERSRRRKCTWDGAEVAERMLGPVPSPQRASDDYRKHDGQDVGEVLLGALGSYMMSMGLRPILDVSGPTLKNAEIVGPQHVTYERPQ